MNFNAHSNLVSKHAFLSPSNYHWLNYDDEKLANVYKNCKAAEKGTRIHAFAKEAIDLGIKLPRSQKTLNAYVNDAIGYRMTAEQPLMYSDFCFGTADSISFRNDILRIHDLKTGITPASMNQLLIYAALFCLEYGISPKDIEMILRIYQNDESSELVATSDDVKPIMEKIEHFNDVLEGLKEED